jgi:hypothetical protein
MSSLFWTDKRIVRSMRRSDVARLPSLVMTALEMQRRPAAFKRQALNEPVTITSNGEPVLVVMSVEEYRRLKDGPGSIGVPQSSQAGYRGGSGNLNRGDGRASATPG